VYVQSIARLASGPVALLTVRGEATQILSIVPVQLVHPKVLSKHPRLTLHVGIINEQATLSQQQLVYPHDPTIHSILLELFVLTKLSNTVSY